MADINAEDLMPETAETLDGSEQFVMFDPETGKRGDINTVGTYILKNSPANDEGYTLAELLEEKAPKSEMGNLEDLVTEDKTQIVNAINEAYNHGGGGGEVPEDIAYISPTGDDESGDGTNSNPFLTVDRALRAGAAKIVAAPGIYEQQINMDECKRASISIVAQEYNGWPVFVHPRSFVAALNDPTEDYPEIYSAPSNTDALGGEIRLFQEGVPDGKTYIDRTNRHPMERGQECRSLETTIMPTDEQSDLAVALEEIQMGVMEGNYKYFYNTDDGIVYFSRPVEVTPETPLRCSVADSFFVNARDRSKTINLSGICIKYMVCNIPAYSNCRLVDCKAAHAYGSGCYWYANPLNCTFIRCEADGAYNTDGKGDGFNGSSWTSGDKNAKAATITLIDCWAHDCNDDGWSDHARFESLLIGGLYEWNHKGGVTPSYGSQCTCYGVTSRNNYNGFLYTGETSEEKYGCVQCIDCVAENNYSVGMGTGVGFYVRNYYNDMVLVNCKSIGNSTGYRADANTFMHMTDCGALNSTSHDKVINGKAILTVKNTQVVTA